MDKKIAKYEWIGDADKTVEAPVNEHSVKYYELKSYYEKKYSRMGELFVERGGDHTQLDFALNEWQTEMGFWLG